MKITAKKESELKQAAKALLAFSGRIKVFAIYGEMGVGKTTFIKYLCNEIGVRDNVSSPTFSIINQYGAGRRKIYHIDLYRTETEKEIIELGLEEIFLEDDYCFVEWAEKCAFILPHAHIAVKLETDDHEQRIITFQ